MFNLDKFISKYVIKRDDSLFAKDLESHQSELHEAIYNSKVCVIGGAGSIGSSFIKELIKYNPSALYVIDINENSLAELVRDIRSNNKLICPKIFNCYAVSYYDPIFEKIFLNEKGFDIVANFSAHKHVRSEKDQYSVEMLIENNVLKAKKLLDLLKKYPPKHFFCVSTDKAANPVNIMGASKRIMEDLVMSYNSFYKVNTARFANVAFSNGSLPASWLVRLQKNQPLVAPMDVKRYFVSPQESGQICLLACILGKGGEIFFPKLSQDQMMSFDEICDSLLKRIGKKKVLCLSEAEARAFFDNHDCKSDEYPVFYFRSDTTGEKETEEFFVVGEKVNLGRFDSLGVVEAKDCPNTNELIVFLSKLKRIFDKDIFTKEDIVSCIKEYLPNFNHEEKGKNLDQKM